MVITVVDFKIIIAVLQKGVFSFKLSNIAVIIFIVPTEEFFSRFSTIDNLT